MDKPPIQIPGQPSAYGAPSERSSEVGRWPGSYSAERLRATIERARIDLRRGNLNDVIAALEPYVGGSPPKSRHAMWLMSLVLALCGRALVERDGEGAGRQILDRAVSLATSCDIDATGADPEDAADIAAAFRLLGRAHEAVELIHMALREAKTVPWRVRLELGRSFHLTCKDREAVGQLTAALADKPGEPFVLLERARCWAALGDAAETLHDATAAAVGFVSRGRLAEAAEATAEAMRVAPNDSAALSLHAEVLWRQRRVEDALKYATRAADLDPSNVAAQAICAAVLLQLSRFDDALSAAHIVLEQEPANLQALEVSQEALASLGRLGEVLPLVERAIVAEPEAISLIALRGKVFAALDRTDQAERDLAVVLATNPGDTGAALPMAELLVRTDRLADAIRLLERTAGTAPEDAETLYYLGEALRMAGRFEEALDRLDKAVALNPKHANGVASRGLVLLTLDRVDEGLADLYQAHYELQPENFWVVSALGGALVSVGRIADAVAVFSGYVARAKEPAEAELAFGEFLNDRDHAEEALPFLRRAAALAADKALPALLVALHATDQFAEAARLGRDHPELSGRAAVVIADALRLMGEVEEAIAWVGRVIDAEPENVFALIVRAEARRSLGQLDAAEIDLRSALRVDPDNVFACGYLGRILSAQGRFADALPPLEIAARNSADFEADLADVLLSLGRAEEALAHSERAVHEQPADAFALGVHAQVLRSLSRLKEALDVVDRSLAIAPGTAWVRGERALLLALLDRDEEAMAVAKALVKDEPDDANALAIYGVVLNGADQPTAALTALDRSLQLSPTAWARAVRGDALQSLGRYQEAAAGLGKLIESGESDDMWTRERFAEACLRMEPPNPQAALAVLERLDSNDPQVIRTLAQRGDAHLLLGERAEARRDYELGVERAQAIGSRDRWALYSTAWCMWRLGQIKDAARNLMRALDQHKEAFMQLDLGLVMLHSERPRRALAEYQRGIKLTDAVADDQYRRTLLREALQDLDRAIDIAETLKPTALVDDIRDMIGASLQEAKADEVKR